MSARLPQAPPFRYADRLVEQQPGRACVASKRFSAGEESDEQTEVPFSRVIEALCQAAAWVPAEEESAGRIVKIDGAQRLGPVRVGDTLEIRCTVVEETGAALRAESLGTVDGRAVARLQVLVSRVHPEKNRDAGG